MNHSKLQEDMIIERLRDEAKLETRLHNTTRILIEDAADEIERLRERVTQLEGLLIDARDNGLIYWDPVTERGAIERSKMMSRIDVALNRKKT